MSTTAYPRQWTVVAVRATDGGWDDLPGACLPSAYVPAYEAIGDVRVRVRAEGARDVLEVRHAD